MQYQLRDYQVTSGAMAQFVSEWTATVVPLRKQFGFEIVGAWSNAEANRFVWIVGHEGDFEEADRSYYASPERRAMSPNPARFIEHAQEEFVQRAM